MLFHVCFPDTRAIWIWDILVMSLTLKMVYEESITSFVLCRNTLSQCGIKLYTTAVCILLYMNKTLLASEYLHTQLPPGKQNAPFFIKITE